MNSQFLTKKTFYFEENFIKARNIATEYLKYLKENDIKSTSSFEKLLAAEKLFKFYFIKIINLFVNKNIVLKNIGINTEFKAIFENIINLIDKYANKKAEIINDIIKDSKVKHHESDEIMMCDMNDALFYFSETNYYNISEQLLIIFNKYYKIV